MVTVSEILSASEVKFGTSGLRGLVNELTSHVCFASTLGFLTHCKQIDSLPEGCEVLIGCDLRPSSPDIARAVAAAINYLGFTPVYAGAVPTPALALASLDRVLPAVMVTGSHIPFDRNGIKFYTPRGEISKHDEGPILDCSQKVPPQLDLLQLPKQDQSVVEAYVARYSSAFPNLLSGMRIGLYEHSSVGRDINTQILQLLGAEVISLGRSDEFVPIDTEAVSVADREQALTWSLKHGLDAVMSTDGDGDRPLLADETGEYFAGDVLGVLAAGAPGSDVVVTPVSSNTVVERCGWFDTVVRTRIGSPHVLEAMNEARGNAIVGYEANGGFLTQTNIKIAGSHGITRLAPLPTRDAVLPVLATIALAKSKKLTLSNLRTLLPARYSRADRLTNCPTARSQSLVAILSEDDNARSNLMRPLGNIVEVDTTDGLRMRLDNGEFIHFRPSGNAPEFRVYVETGNEARCAELLAETLGRVGELLK